MDTLCLSASSSASREESKLSTHCNFVVPGRYLRIVGGGIPHNAWKVLFLIAVWKLMFQGNSALSHPFCPVFRHFTWKTTQILLEYPIYNLSLLICLRIIGWTVKHHDKKQINKPIIIIIIINGIYPIGAPHVCESGLGWFPLDHPLCWVMAMRVFHWTSPGGGEIEFWKGGLK